LVTLNVLAPYAVLGLSHSTPPGDVGLVTPRHTPPRRAPARAPAPRLDPPYWCHQLDVFDLQNVVSEKWYPALPRGRSSCRWGARTTT
jgi:hypothetical protein